ncbi:unnamed protein product, partial [marine sediment metagenome]
MPTLEGFNGASLVPNIGAQLGRGARVTGQLQNQQIQRQQQEQIALQAQAEADRQARLQGLLGQGGGQPARAGQLGGQQLRDPVPAGPSQPASGTPDFERLAIEFPEEAKQIAEAQKAQFDNLQADEKSRVASVVTEAAQLKGLPVPQQIARLEARRAELTVSGTPTNDTDEHLALLRAGRIDEANAVTDQAVQLGERLGILKPAGGAEGEAITPFQRESLALKGQRLAFDREKFEGGDQAAGREDTAGIQDFKFYQDLKKTDPEAA